MKEYKSKTGGRYIFNEDIQNLQELALSMTSMFSDCSENFVISGCAITISGDYGSVTVSVSSGFAYISGKIIKVNAHTETVSDISNAAIVLDVENGPEIMYADGSTDYQYINYSGHVVINYVTPIPPSPDVIRTITEGQGRYRFPGLRDAFIGKYALVNNGTEETYDQEPEFTGSVMAKKFLLPVNTGSPMQIQGIESTVGEESPYDPEIINEGVLLQGVTINNAPIFGFNGMLVTPQAVIGNLNITGEGFLINGQSIGSFLSNLFLSLAGGTMRRNAAINLIGIPDPSDNPLSQIGDAENDQSTDIRPGRVVVAGAGGEVETIITGGTVVTDDLIAETVKSDKIESNDSNVYVSTADVISFFSSFTDNEIELKSPVPSVGQRGGIKIYANSINGQYIEVKNSTDEEGDRDETRINAGSINFRNDDDTAVINARKVSIESVEADYLVDKYSSNTASVSTIVNFFADFSSGITQDITVKDRNDVSMVLRFSNGILVGII